MTEYTVLEPCAQPCSVSDRLKTFVVSIFEWPFYTGFTVVNHILILHGYWVPNRKQNTALENARGLRVVELPINSHKQVGSTVS